MPYDRHDQVAVRSFADATVVQDQERPGDQVRIQFDNGTQVSVPADMLTLVRSFADPDRYGDNA